MTTAVNHAETPSPRLNLNTLASFCRNATIIAGDYVKLYLTNIPLGINFDITYNCNLRCEHCYYWASIAALGIKKKELSDDQWTDVFKHYSTLGVQNVSLTGGEPTLRMNVIEKAHEYFDHVQTATNGIIRIPEHVQPGGIWLSIDGPEEIHDKIRRSKGVFQRLQQNYQDDSRVLACSTISTTNYKYIENIVKIAESMNLKGVVFMIYSGSHESPLLPQGKVYWTVMKELHRVINEYKDFVLITDDMLQAYHNKQFVKSCPFTRPRPSIVSYYADMTRKRCVMGDNADCSACSCAVPVAFYVLRHNFTNLNNYKSIMRILF
jgi:sulfatase maturation enzyme AslB (radical SAM superfamily)